MNVRYFARIGEELKSNWDWKMRESQIIQVLMVVEFAISFCDVLQIEGDEDISFGLYFNYFHFF